MISITLKQIRAARPCEEGWLPDRPDLPAEVSTFTRKEGTVNWTYDCLTYRNPDWVWTIRTRTTLRRDRVEGRLPLASGAIPRLIAPTQASVCTWKSTGGPIRWTTADADMGNAPTGIPLGPPIHTSGTTRWCAVARLGPSTGPADRQRWGAGELPVTPCAQGVGP